MMKTLLYSQACIREERSNKQPREVGQPMENQKTLNGQRIADPMQRTSLPRRLVPCPVAMKRKILPNQREGILYL